MKAVFLSGFFVVTGALTVGCAPKPATPPPAAKTEVQDDRIDLAQLDDIVEDWHRAWKTENRALEQQVDARLKRWVKQELAEDRQQVQSAKAEATNSASTRNQHAAADDRKDAAKAKNEASNTREIAVTLNTLQVRFDEGNAAPGQYQHKSDLLRQLQRIAKRELERSKQEAAEDSRQATSNSPPQPTPAAAGPVGGGDKASSKSPEKETIGAKKLVMAIDQWISGRAEGKPKQVKEADTRIKWWWQQQLSREKPWSPRAKQIAVELKKSQPVFNRNEASPAQFKNKKALLVELRKLAKARAAKKP